MDKILAGEKWKKIKFKTDIETDSYFKISNLGRVKSYNKFSNGNFIVGSLTEGYRIVRFKLYKPRELSVEKKINILQKKIVKIIKLKAKLALQKGTKKEISILQKQLILLKKELSTIFLMDAKERQVFKHFLIHREVAVAFLPKPKPSQLFVAHLDYKKENNIASNLQWMTQEEIVNHQQTSPFALKEKNDRRESNRKNGYTTKLTTTKVMLLKKMLSQQKPMKELVEKFKITETQVYRIKRGENWGDVEAAK